MKSARLPASASVSSSPTQLGLVAQIALVWLDGNRLANMAATSEKAMWLALARPDGLAVMVALALTMPWGLPTPLPWRNAYSSYQAIARAKSVYRNFSSPKAASW